MKKKILATVISVLILISMLPLSAFAASVSYINSVHAYNIQKPEIGDLPTYTADIVGSGYYVDTSVDKYDTVVQDMFINQLYYIYNGIGWYDETGKSWMYTSQAFQDGHRYTAYVYLTTAGGYEFDENGITARVNSNLATVTYDDKDPAHSIVVTYTFECTTTDIELIMLRNAPAPVAGQTPADYTGFTPVYPEYYQLDTDHGVYYINGIRWENESGRQLTANSKFVEGEQYKVQIAVVPYQNNGYEVSDFIYSLEAMIDGEYVTEGGGPYGWDGIYVASTSLVYIYYTLPAAVAAPDPEPDPDPEESTVIERIEVTDVADPVAFSMPMFGASVDEGANYRIWTDSELYPGMSNGMIWKNMTDDMPVLPDIGRFVPEKAYTAAIFLEANEGLTFADDGSLICTVNGEPAEAFFYGDNPRYVCIYKEYYVDTVVINEVEVEITEPVAGEKPVDYVSIDDPKYFSGVYVSGDNPNGIVWEDLTDGFEGILTNDDIFKSGHEYRVAVCIESMNGCRFNVDENGYLRVSAYVNGESASVLSSDSFPADRYVFVVYDFVVEGELEEEYVLGDANGDGEVKTADSLIAKRIAAGIDTPTPDQEKALDVNRDDKINSADTNLISRFIAGIIIEF